MPLPLYCLKIKVRQQSRKRQDWDFVSLQCQKVECWPSRVMALAKLVFFDRLLTSHLHHMTIVCLCEELAKNWLCSLFVVVLAELCVYIDSNGARCHVIRAWHRSCTIEYRQLIISISQAALTTCFFCTNYNFSTFSYFEVKRSGLLSSSPCWVILAILASLWLWQTHLLTSATIRKGITV